MRLSLPEKRDMKNRINVTFKNSSRELELYLWLKEKGEVGSCAGYIKQILYAVMEEEKANKKKQG